MLKKSGLDALKALLELGLNPRVWRSTNELATAQDLPSPMLEQLLLRLRRAGLIEARRGRLGGYRLAKPASQIPIAHVLAAAQDLGQPAAETLNSKPDSPAALVTKALQQRLELTMTRALEQTSLEELLFDWHSAKASQNDDGGLLIG